MLKIFMGDIELTGKKVKDNFTGEFKTKIHIAVTKTIGSTAPVRMETEADSNQLKAAIEALEKTAEVP